MKSALGDEAFFKSQWSKVLAGKVQYTGPTYRWVGLSDLLWGRLVYVLGGERVFIGLPIMAFQKELQHPATTVSDIVSKFTSMTRDEIKENGGFARIVESGDGLVVPPGYLLADANTGSMPDCTMDSVDAPCDVAVAWQNIYCTHGHGFDRLFGSVFDELSMCQVIPTLTREQQVNFDMGLYAVTNQLFKEMPGFMQNFQNAEKMLEQLHRQGGHFRTKQECSSSPAAGYVQPGATAAVVDSDQNEGEPNFAISDAVGSQLCSSIALG